MDRLGERARLVEVGRRGLAPEQVGVRRVGQAARDRRLEAAARCGRSPRRALAGEERPVALVDVAREQLGADARRCARRAASARRSTSAARRAAISVRMNCAASAPAPCRPGGRTSSRDASWSSKWTPAAPASIIAFISSKALSGPPKPASASATIGANQSRRRLPFGVLDLVGALQRVVDPPHHAAGTLFAG